jgi:hypothetical protein
VGISPQQVKPSKASLRRKESSFAQTETKRNLITFDLNVEELADT